MLFLAGCFWIAACNRADSRQVSTAQKSLDKPDGASASSTASSNDMEIAANANLLSRMKTGEPPFAQVGATLEVTGRLEVDDTRVTRLGSPVMGRIISAPIHEGENVTRGQVLATLSSTGLADAQLAFLKALSQRQLAQRGVERAQLLLKADVIGSAELQRREAEASQASVEADAARDELLVLGMTPESIFELERTRAINSVVRIIANMDAIVMARKVTVGQVVQPADSVFEIADLTSLWLVADVPEQNAGNLHAGQGVKAELSAFPAQPIRGRLTFVSATLNPETRTVRARMDLPNLHRRFKPAMLATMTLSDQTERLQVVPTSAIVREENADYVFVQANKDTFILRPVTLGEEHGAVRVLMGGVRPGEKIVLDGAFHLNNERRRLLLRGKEGY